MHMEPIGQHRTVAVCRPTHAGAICYLVIDAWEGGCSGSEDSSTDSVSRVYNRATQVNQRVAQLLDAGRRGACNLDLTFQQFRLHIGANPSGYFADDFVE